MEGRVAAQQPPRVIPAKRLETRPSFDMQLYGQASGRRGRHERSILNCDAFAAAIGLVQFGLEQGRQTILEIGEVGAKMQSEGVLALAPGRRGNIAGDSDGYRLAGNRHRYWNGRDLKCGIRAENGRGQHCEKSPESVDSQIAETKCGPRLVSCEIVNIADNGGVIKTKRPGLKNVLIRTLYGFALFPVLAMAAVPTIQSVTDSAGYGPRVAPGSIASLFGTGLASGIVQASGFPLTTTLGGSSVSVAGVPAPLFYVSPGQINFQVPSSTASGDVGVVVNGPGGASASFSFTVTAQAPAIYQYGTNRAVAQNADGSLNSDSAPAAAGSVITVYLTGQGGVSSPVPDGDATPSSSPDSAVATATATIGTQSATVQFLGLTPEFAGLAQANIQVPALPTGDYPLVITVGGLVSASAVISVSGSGTAYTSPLTLVGSVAFANSDPSSIVFYDGIAYICGQDQIVMVNVTTPAAPTIIGSFGASTLNGDGDRCAINAAAATPYLVEIVGSPSSSQESFAIYSLSNPQSPVLLTVTAISGGSTPYGHIVALSFYGNYGIATTSYITYYTNSNKVASQNG